MRSDAFSQVILSTIQEPSALLRFNPAQCAQAPHYDLPVSDAKGAMGWVDDRATGTNAQGNSLSQEDYPNSG
jgi:hypothetical protein